MYSLSLSLSLNSSGGGAPAFARGVAATLVRTTLLPARWGAVLIRREHAMASTVHRLLLGVTKLITINNMIA